MLNSGAYGVFVPHASRQTIKEIYEEREVLETFAVRKICENHEELDLTAISAIHEKMTAIRQRLEQTDDAEELSELSGKWRLLDASFHLSLLQIAGNRRIFQSASDLQTMRQTVLHQLETKRIQVVGRTHEEHAYLLESLRNGDVVKAQGILTRHIRQGCSLALKAHDQNYMNGSASLVHGPHSFASANYDNERGYQRPAAKDRAGT